MNNAVISIRELYKSFDHQPVLIGVDLDILEGEILVILGGSGSGKSVLLKCVSGLMEADAGSIQVLGEEVVGRSEKDLLTIRRKMGILFQGGALFDSMSVFDNVAFAILECIPGLHPVTVQEKVNRMLTLVGLPDAGDRMPAQLSGGMQKRAALARAMALEPAIMFYDEPTTGLDPVTARRIGTLIHDMRDTLGVTSVVVSHDIELAFTIADRIALLQDGVLVFTGRREEIRKCGEPAVCEFLGDFYRHSIQWNGTNHLTDRGRQP